MLCIDNFYNFYQDISDESAAILEAIARSGADRGMYMYIVCTVKALATLNMSDVQLFKELIKSGNGIITGGELKSYQAFNDFHREGNITFGQHEGCIIHNGRVISMMFGKP